VTAPSTPRFGVWANVYGTWASHHHPDDPVDASWDRNRNLILAAERLGFDSTLIAQHTYNPLGDELDQLEAWSAAAALAEATERIEIITAIKPTLYHPAVFAKLALGVEAISHGRLSINLVNAWFRPELERAGIPFVEHDQRYAYGEEWLSIVTALFGGARVNHEGPFFTVRDYLLKPTGLYRPRPPIYLGGESPQARDLAAKGADVWFINGQPPENVRGLIADVSSRPRTGPPLRFGLAAFVIARPTDEEAAAALAQAWELSARDEPLLEKLYPDVDPKAEMFKTFAKYPAIGTNGGTAAGLVGSYDRVAERIHEFAGLGIETFMLQFQPFEAEMERFAHEVAPRARRLSTLAGATR
jgi:alkanesulfonate monooxygenase